MMEKSALAGEGGGCTPTPFHSTNIYHHIQSFSVRSSSEGRYIPPFSSLPYMHRRKRFTSFPSPAGMSLTKLPLGRNNSVMTSLFPPRESLVMTSRLGTGNSRTFFYGVYSVVLSIEGKGRGEIGGAYKTTLLLMVNRVKGEGMLPAPRTLTRLG
jgi:hypothetical protein